MSEGTESKGHIVALGGGGFAMETDNTFLDDFVLSLANKSTPKVCLVPTAKGPDLRDTVDNPTNQNIQKSMFLSAARPMPQKSRPQCS